MHRRVACTGPRCLRPRLATAPDYTRDVWRVHHPSRPRSPASMDLIVAAVFLADEAGRSFITPSFLFPLRKGAPLESAQNNRSTAVGYTPTAVSHRPTAVGHRPNMTEFMVIHFPCFFV